MKNLKNGAKNFLSRFFPPILWCSFIFYLSSQPELKISQGIQDLILRKIGHIFEYFILVILVARAQSGSFFKINKKSIIFGTGFSFFFAISDEYYQTFVPGRIGSPVDVGIDTIGIILAAIFLKRVKSITSWQNKFQIPNQW